MTAAIIAMLDLVITIDTSIAHVAGALGKPMWVLLPFSADWRWLRHRGDSPWYPTARLKRGDFIFASSLHRHRALSSCRSMIFSDLPSPEASSNEESCQRLRAGGNGARARRDEPIRLKKRSLIFPNCCRNGTASCESSG
jgi:hypothetical protein